MAGKTIAEIIGEIVWLMTQDKVMRELPIREIERLVMPGILLRQFHIKYAEVPAGYTVQGDPVRKPDGAEAKPNLQPISVEIFAMVSDAVAAALEANPGVAMTLQDWRSGPHKKVLCKAEIGG